MRLHQKLWSVRFETEPVVAEALSQIFDGALAITVLAPPRQNKASVEALYDAPPELSALQAHLSVLCLLQGAEPPTLRLDEVPKLDWLQKVSEDFPPLPAGRWMVFGAQHKQAILNPRLGLQIDATSAFGTGEHPTTRGCLIMLNQLLKRHNPHNILDMGCGSGILAIAAVKSRAARAIGIDMDADSVTVADYNARHNGVRRRFLPLSGRGYGSRTLARRGPYDLVLANIFASPLSEMAKDLKRVLKPGGIVILSGLLSGQANRVIAAHRLQKLELIHHSRLGEWSVLALRRRKRAR